MMPQPLSDHDIRKIAIVVSEVLVTKLSDEKTVEHITSVWGKYLDQMIGRGFRRVGWTVFIIALGFAAVKFDVFKKLLTT